MKHTTLLILILCVAGVSSDGQSSGCPNLVNYQGRVTDAGGVPVADGDYEFIFRFFTVPAGGSDLWSELDTLPVTEGLFNHLLGSVNPLPAGLFPDNDILYLEVTVEGEVLPRTLMVSVGYARRVNTVHSAAGGTILGETQIAGAGASDLIVLGTGDPNVALELRSGTFGGNPFIDFANDAATDYDARIQLGDDGQLDIYVDSALVLPTGKVGIGTATPGSEAGLTNTRLEIADANGLNSDFTLRVSGGGATGSAAQNFAKSRGTLSSPTVVQDGDWLGHILFIGYDGTDFASPAAWIRGVVDGTPGAGDMPGRLEFLTTPDGSSTPTTQMTITNAGKVGIGTTTPGSEVGLTGTRVEIADANGLNSDFTLRVSGGGATGSAAQNFAKSRGTLSSPTVVQNGDWLGHILFVGYDGTDFASPAAWVRGVVDGTPGLDDMPGRLEFLTTPDGSSTPTTRMTISNSGNIGVGTSSPQGALDVSSTTGAFIVPRMTTAQRGALSAVNGMIIYNTDDNQFNFYENGAWVTK